MPGFDGTGPMGRGAMTGWGRGVCSAPPQALYGPLRVVAPGYGRGYGRGRGIRGGFGPGFGRGRGYGRGSGRRDPYPAWGGGYRPTYAPGYGGAYFLNPQEELNALKDEAGFMKSELEAIQKRIEELESSSAE